MPFAENLKRMREAKGLSQAELASRAEVSQPMIAQYEKGLKIPTIVTAVSIAKILDTTCEELLEIKQEEKR